MYRAVSKAILRITAVLSCVLLSNSTDARPVYSWTMQELAKQADLLLVGEVLDVESAGTISPGQTHWTIPLLRMKASVRVLRVFPSSEKFTVATGDLISLEYQAIDRDKTNGVVNGPEFPSLSIGDVFAFPLRKATAGKEVWKLIGEEDSGLLVPCAKEPLRAGALNNGVEFLQLELAGTFTKGKYQEVFKAGTYLYYCLHHGASESFDTLFNLVTDHAGDDEPRWLEIAVATYCSMGGPRPKIADLLKTQAQASPQAALVAKALSHVQRTDLESNIITESLRHSQVHTWGTALTLSTNYPRHPTTLKLLARTLKNDQPEGLYIVRFLIRAKDHPLVRTAVSAATRMLTRSKSPDSGSIWAACELIRDYGDEKEFALLLDELKKAQNADRRRYRMLWQASAYAKNQRLIPICGIVLNDRGAFSEDLRFCDVAASELQRVTGADFGKTFKRGLAERDAAVEKARAWLRKNTAHPRRQLSDAVDSHNWSTIKRRGYHWCVG